MPPKVGIHDMSREQRVERALAMAFKLVEVTTQVIDSDSPEEDGSYLRACIGESLSLDLHFGMCAPAPSIHTAFVC